MKPSHPSTPKTILIVDDDLGVSECLEHVLVSNGYRVLSGGSLHQLQRLDPRSVDLVLLDIAVVNRNGWEPYVDFTSIVTPIPIILLNGCAEPPADLLPPNVRASLDKPFDPPSLFATLRYVFGSENGPEHDAEPLARDTSPDRLDNLRVSWAPTHQWSPLLGGA